MTVEPRGWIRTFTGGRFWPLHPNPNDVNIVDIAHALGMKCRYGGHPKFFYSVAEHCCHLADHAPADLKFFALMHDAPEAYSPFGDVPRPLKQQMPLVAELEERIWAVISHRYLLPLEEPAELKSIDMRICVDEKAQLMANASAVDPSLPGDLAPLGVVVEGWQPERAKAEFLRRFERLAP